MAAPKTHVIELASPAFIRSRYVKRETQDGGFVVTTNSARARRYVPSAAANALAALQGAIERQGFTPTVVPVAALEGAHDVD